MRSKNSNRSMEMERPIKLNKEETHLSGAYIRSLVKQLSSSRSKEPMKDEASQDHNKPQNQSPPPPPPPPPQQPPHQLPHKKQVRRRLHTSKPYQERLLNMAEARREIVTALKIHRAAMKEQQQQQQQQQSLTPTSSAPQPSPVPLSPFGDSHQEIVNSSGNFRAFPFNYPFPNGLYNTQFSPFSYPLVAPPTTFDNLDFPLPSQPLGLNLNFQGFNNIDASFCNENSSKPPIQIQSSPTSSCSYSSPTMVNIEASPTSKIPTLVDPSSSVLHPMMDDEEMAEIHSIVEQHDMEWNDTVNLVTSAWWSKFLKKMEGDVEESRDGGDGDDLHAFNEIFDMPSCFYEGFGLENEENNIMEQHLYDNYRNEDYSEDALPRLEIEEIDGWDGEWLS